MKFQLFCFLSAIFMVIGLLLPSGVYAEDTPSSSPTVIVMDVDSNESCANSTTPPAAAATTAEAVAGDRETTPTVEDTPNDPNQCQNDDDGSNSRVSWNS